MTIVTQPPVAATTPTIAGLVAEVIARELVGAEDGHCVRVNHLDRAFALETISRLRETSRGADIIAHLLTRRPDDGDPIAIPADRAIEIRNRKQGIFCLFIPAEAHDTTASSLGNSFAELNGGDLIEAALRRFLNQDTTSKPVRQAMSAARQSFATVGIAARPTASNELDFAIAAQARVERGEEDAIGLELWRLGLIPDAAPDFAGRLRRNRQAVSEIARPRRITASLEDRVKSLRLRPESAANLGRFLRGRNLHDAKEWTHDLYAEGGSTFDQWLPLENTVPADCERLAIDPFIDPLGALLVTGRGLVQDAPGGPLFAPIGERDKLRIRWQTIPTKTTVTRWLLEVVPANEDVAWDHDAVELPVIEIKKGIQRQGTLSLNLGLLDDDDVPREALRVRLTATTETGETLPSTTGEPLIAYSQEFFLRRGGEDGNGDPRERKRTAATLPEGILRAVVAFGARPEELEGPQWIPGDRTTAFTVRATPREAIALTFSTILDRLQARTLAEPEQLGIWEIEQDDQVALRDESLRPTIITTTSSNEEREFRLARRRFFSQVLSQEVRHRIEVSSWDSTLVDAAVRYARAWAKWLRTAAEDDLVVARSVDTLRMRIGDPERPVLDATIVLPTHPLRALWFAGQATLFQDWAARLVDRKPADRKQAVDLAMVASVTAANTPPLAHHPKLVIAQPHIFFRNLDAGHGVAMPAGTDDPAARMALLGGLLGFASLQDRANGHQPERAAATLGRFREAHPYADPFSLALVNPDDGTFAADVLGIWSREQERIQSTGEEGDEPEPAQLPGLLITAYTREASQRTTLRGLEQRRRAAEEHVTTEPSDHLRPALAIIQQPISELEASAPPDARDDQHHLAIIQDLSVPAPVATDDPAPVVDDVGLGLHGLIARYTSARVPDKGSVTWHYWIQTEAPVTPHPLDKRLSDGLVELHRAASLASARLIDPDRAVGPRARAVLAVRLYEQEMTLLDHIHRDSDWVLTVDRFVGADLFDSPRDRALSPERQAYILDASPDFYDGLGHRSLVTTSSREEVEAILARAMGKFGFRQLHESVGGLIHTLKTISGRLVLDALRADARAAEVVALGAVVAWLQSQGLLRDAIVVPVDTHLDLFRPNLSDRTKGQSRCDLLLFRFKPNRVELTVIEVKGRSGIDDLERLGETIVAQLDSTAALIEQRCFDDDRRVDGVLQRSSLAHVLAFYLQRAKRYRLVDAATADQLAKRISQLERGPLTLDITQRGYVVALAGAPGQKRMAMDERTEIQVLTIDDVAAAVGDLVRLETETPASEPGTDASETDEPEQPALRPEPDWPGNANGKDDRPAEPMVAADDPAPDETGSAPNRQPPPDRPPSDNSATEPTALAAPPTQDVVLGDAEGNPISWQPRVSGSPHLFILGIPGQGKSVTTERILTELATSGTPALVLDFHGTYANPEGHYARIARPALIDAAQGLPFSPFAIDPRSSWLEVQQHARGITEVVDHVFGLGEIQADVFYTTLRNLYQRRGFSDVDDDAPLPQPPTFADVAKALDRRAKEAGVRNVLARTRALFEFDLFKPAAQGAPAFTDALQHGVVIGLHRLGGEELALALSAFLLRTVYLAMTSWEIADQIRLVIVLDEAHKLARDVTLPKLMKEGRKYGVAVVVASQGLADFHNDVVGNAGTKVSFRVNHGDSRKIAGFFQGRGGQDLETLLETLAVGQALIQTANMRYAVRAKMWRADDTGA
jgi:hypothetical protein